MDLQSFFDLCRGIARDNYNAGEFTNENLIPAFQAAWAKVIGILQEDGAPVVSGWIYTYLPAYGSAVSLGLYGYAGGIAQLQYAVADAWTKPTGIAESMDGLVITVQSTADLVAAGLANGKSIVLVDVNPALGLSGAYTISLGSPVSDQSLLIPGLRIRENASANFNEIQIGTRARVVYCAQGFSSYPAISPQNLTQGSVSPVTHVTSADWIDQFSGWELTNGNVQIPVSPQARVIAMRGVAGITAPNSMTDEIPEQLQQVLAHATLGYSSRETNPSTSQSWLTTAFGPGMGDVFPYQGFMGTLLAIQMKSGQASGPRTSAVGDFYRGQP